MSKARMHLCDMPPRLWPTHCHGSTHAQHTHYYATQRPNSLTRSPRPSGLRRTNYAVNRGSKNYAKGEDGSKRSIKSVMDLLLTQVTRAIIPHTIRGDCGH